MLIISRRRIPVAAAITGTALIVSACGGSPSPTTTTSAANQSPQTMAAAAFKYAQCMRTHGVSDFPDPKVSIGAGHASVAILVKRGTVASPAFKAAQTACRGIVPEPSPSQIAQQQQHEEQGKLSFARCMRSHGITSFPDPTQQGELNITRVTAAGIDIHAPAFLAAASACVPASDGTIPAAAVQQLRNGAQ